MTLGQACRVGKNRNGIGDDNKLPYVLLADPAMKMAYPTQYNVVTTSCSDTIRALTIHKVSGHIIDSLNTVMDWFNGKISVTVYDKLQVITTRDNDEKDPTKQQLLSYNDYPNVLFSSEVDVKDGKFEFTFMAPKDIRYNFGNGRIVYYAYDSEPSVIMKSLSLVAVRPSQFWIPLVRRLTCISTAPHSKMAERLTKSRISLQTYMTRTESTRWEAESVTI